MIQQAISQVLTPLYEELFSEYSYGFRPGRNAHQAIKQAQLYINSGYKIVVDIDLEKFFDRVNHDKLMHLLSINITDKRVLRLIRRYLESGVMIGGIASATEEGTPQGGPLSPLLSNVMLNELDKELEKRGHKFCRYADDCNIYVKSKRGGERVMESVSRYIENHLKLKVNTSKSSVDYPNRRKFLGFSFYRNKEEIRLRVHPKPVDRFKMKVRKLTSRSNGKSMGERYEKLNNLLVGWLSYFRIADMRSHCIQLDEWIRRRLRMCYWKQWKKIKTRYENLISLGMSEYKSWQYANTRKGYWRISSSPILHKTLTNKFFKEKGLVSLLNIYEKYLKTLRTAVCRTARTVV